MEELLRYAEPGDVVITDVGETVEDVGKPVVWLGEGKVAIHDHCYALRHSLNPKYVSDCMQTSSFIYDKTKYVVRAKVKTLLINTFAKAKIPVPFPNDPESRWKNKPALSPFSTNSTPSPTPSPKAYPEKSNSAKSNTNTTATCC